MEICQPGKLDRHLGLAFEAFVFPKPLPGVQTLPANLPGVCRGPGFPSWLLGAWLTRTP